MYHLSVRTAKSKYLGIFILLGIFINSANIHAEVLFEDNFESGTLTTEPKPRWSWPEPITPSNQPNDMMYGENDIYYVTNDRAFTGDYSLRLNFAGRNNWCNQCGSRDITLTSSHLSSGCVVASGAPWGDSIFNYSNGFSQWDITSQTETQFCFNKTAPIGGTMFSHGQSSITAGDTIKLPNKCGVNGDVGGSTGRRSDCNKAINYLRGVSSADLGYGESISRRFYLFIPTGTTLPGMTLKLGYAHFNKNGSTVSNTLKLSVQRDISLELSTPGGTYVDSNFRIQRDAWYYFEETWTRESSSSASDGRYMLYVSPAGQAVTTPEVSFDNVKIGSLVDMSINGNFQHNNDVSGYIYFDDVKIADTYIGPIGVKIPNQPTHVTATPIE